MKRNAPVPPSSRLLIAPLCVALVLAVDFAKPPPAQAQDRGNADTPSKLWRTYPLDPSKGKAPIAKEPEPHRGLPPRSMDRGVSPGTDAGDAAQPSEVGGHDSRALEPLALFALTFLGLLLFVLVALPIARMIPSVPHSLARVGSALASPVRAVASVPRHSSSSAACDGAALSAVRPTGIRPGSRLIAPLGHAVRFLSSKRHQIVLYALVVLTSATLGVAVALLLGGI
jgi:hypothetical protein